MPSSFSKSLKARSRPRAWFEPLVASALVRRPFVLGADAWILSAPAASTGHFFRQTLAHHRPAFLGQRPRHQFGQAHSLQANGHTAQRIVLGDWYQQGSVLRVTADGLELSAL